MQYVKSSNNCFRTFQDLACWTLSELEIEIRYRQYVQSNKLQI